MTHTTGCGSCWPRADGATMADRPCDYRVTLRPLPSDGRPPTIRLRLFLKVALRAFGLRAVEVEEVSAIAAAAQRRRMRT
jgi:hypothetical protein